MYFLPMSGRLALHPLFLAGTAVIVGKTGFYSFCRASAFIQATISTRRVCQSWAMAQTKPFHQILRHSAAFRLYSTCASFSHIFRRPLIAITNALRFLLHAWPVSLRGYSLRRSGSYWRPIPHRPSFFNTVHQVLNRTDTAGSNNRNIDRFANRACQRQVETLWYRPVHTGQQNLARTASLHFDSPFHRIQTGRITSAVGKDFPTGVFRVDRFGIHGNNNRLRTKKKPAASFTKSGLVTAAVLMLALSAPALSRRRISATVRTPPPPSME